MSLRISHKVAFKLGLLKAWLQRRSASKLTQVIDMLRNTHFQGKSHSGFQVPEPRWILAGAPEHTGIGSLLHEILCRVGHTGLLASPV